MIVAGALNREESRGSHFRTDFPERNDEKWLKHTIASFVNGTVKIGYKPVTITQFKPQARTY